MNGKAEDTEYRLDGVKWLLVLGIIGLGVYANSQFATVALLYRGVAGVIG